MRCMPARAAVECAGGQMRCMPARTAVECAGGQMPCMPADHAGETCCLSSINSETGPAAGHERNMYEA